MLCYWCDTLITGHNILPAVASLVYIGLEPPECRTLVLLQVLQDYEVQQQQQQSNESERTSAGCCIHTHSVE